MPPASLPKPLDSQIIRFIAVGTINTAFSYGLYAFFLFIGFNYAIANLLALLLGIVFSFKTQGRFVFSNTDNRLFLRFVLGWAIIYLATILLIGQLVAQGLNAYLAGALALPFSTVLSYLVQKHLVFSKRDTNALLSERSHPEKKP